MSNQSFINGEHLFSAIGSASDSALMQTEKSAPSNRLPYIRRFAAIAAAAVTVSGLGIWKLGFTGWNSGGTGLTESSAGSSSFMSYAGPVLPLDVKEEDCTLSASRNITFDFSAWGDPEILLVHDLYTLTNPSDETQTYTLLYPFISSIDHLDQDLPELFLNGTSVETTVIPGDYAGGFKAAGNETNDTLNLSEPSGWEDYAALLTDGSYQEKALSAHYDFTDIPITLYRFSNAFAPEKSDKMPNPTLRAVFGIDFSRSTILTYGIDQWMQDSKKGIAGIGFSLCHLNDPTLMAVIGEDVQNLTASSYVTGGWDTKKEISSDQAGADISRENSDLESFLRLCIQEEWTNYQNRILNDSEAENPYILDFESYYTAYCSMLTENGVLSNNPADRYQTGSIEEIDVNSVKRVFYLEVPLTVKAGESVSLSAESQKSPSFDYACVHTENSGVYGYDLLTRAGSSLTFTGQTASLQNSEKIDIVRQNFGFDPSSDVFTVSIDEEEHYYLEVCAKGEES